MPALTDEDRDAMNAYSSEWGERYYGAREALSENRPRDAVAWLLKPGRYVAVPIDRPLLADAYFRIGAVNDAYRVMADGMRAGNADRAETLRASLVAALNGEVYRGQREYVAAFLKTRAGNSWKEDRVPAGFSPKTLVFLSTLALAEDSRDQFDPNYYYYSVEANRLDPTNVDAACNCA